MIKLPNEFKKWGFDWKVLKRFSDIAIIEQKSEYSVNYNVVIIRKNKEFEICGNLIPAKESIPAEAQWGIYAWNYGKDIKSAENKYNELIQKV